MTWADTLDDHPLLALAILLAIQLPIFYMISPKSRYFVRMFAYNSSILFAAFISSFLAIPGYLRGCGANTCFACFRACTRWLDVNAEVRNAERLDAEGSAVIISNHQSSLDVIGMGKVWPDRCTVMMKNSLKYVPFFNIAAILSCTVFVERFKRDKAAEALHNAVNCILGQNLKIWVFPEGTRNPGASMLPFKKGAFNIAVQAQIPIVPVVFSDYSPFYSKKERRFDANGQIVGEVLEPVSTKGLTQEDVPALTDRIRNDMLKAYERLSAEAAKRQAEVSEKTKAA
uniref:1-acyl-sn-glycerol-3-phosphate acyltransferase n=1 Tax=Panagrellus redivivus TaxID=6233 RepID=A0A7E4V8B4_PANRE